MVDHDDFDLTSIAGVDRSRRVDQPEPGSGREARPRVDERGIAVRQGDGHAGGQQGSLAGRKREVRGGHDVGAGITEHGVGGQRQIGLQPLHEDLKRHGRKGTLDRVSNSSERPVAAPGTTLYREHLRTPWAWYPVALFVAGLLAAEFHVGHHTLTDWIPWCTLLPLSLIAVWLFGHSYVEIRDGELRIRGAHIPLEEITGAVALDAATLRRVVGREGDPAAFVSIRPWIGPGVQLWLDDPEDPTPYWVISSRAPQEVVDIVRAHAR